MSASAATANNAPSRRFAFSVPEKSATFWLYALLGLLAVMHISMATGRSVNWDEFWFYSQVETVARGEFIQPLQTIHTRFFFWLPAMPGNEIDHVMIARIFMLACLAVTASSIYAIAEKLSDHRLALLAVATFLAAGFTLQHGASFRVDPIVTALLTSGLAIAARTRLSTPAIVALGALIGLAGMVTIKFVLWAPAFAGIALWRWQDEGWNWQYIARWVAAGAVALATFALLYTLHATTGGPQEANEVAGGILERTSGKMLGLASSPHLHMSGKAIFTAVPLAIAALLVPLAIARMDASWQSKAALGLLWFPILTPLYYHNALPYFYPFILAPVAALTVFTLPFVVKRYGSHMVAGVIAASALTVWIVDARGVTTRQHALVDAVHQTFPEPVAYIDCCGMIGTFTKVNEFRTRWGIEKYLRTGKPLIREAMMAQPVPLLLDNKDEFADAIDGVAEHTLHPQDTAAIRANYIRLWGDIFVAGRNVEAQSSVGWDVMVPGTYTVEGALTINGQSYRSGDLVELKRGTSQLSNDSAKAARLVWGDNTPTPSGTEPELYWTSF